MEEEHDSNTPDDDINHEFSERHAASNPHIHKQLSDNQASSESLQDSNAPGPDSSENPDTDVHESSSNVHKPSHGYSSYGWKFNPFVFNIDPDAIVGYEKERKLLVDYISQGHKAILVSGPTGAGKTTLLKWAERQFKNSIFFSKPPATSSEMVDFFNHVYPRPFFLWFLGPRFRTVFDVIDFLKKKNRTVLFVDEAHESNEEILEWLRVMTDQVPGITIVVAGLPALDSLLREKVETFYQRISMRIELKSLSYAEMKEMIRLRIESAGGKGMGPFSEDVLKSIYDHTGGFPREVLRKCDSIINGTTQDMSAMRNTMLPELTAMQLDVVNILMKSSMTPTEIVSVLDISKYKSKHHALRSVNNVLKQLLDMGFVRREKSGRSFVYSLLPRIRSIMVES